MLKNIILVHFIRNSVVFSLKVSYRAMVYNQFLNVNNFIYTSLDPYHKSKLNHELSNGTKVGIVCPGIDCSIMYQNMTHKNDVFVCHISTHDCTLNFGREDLYVYFDRKLRI